MLVLMLLYTLSSLWILSQPTVNEKRGGGPPPTHPAPSSPAIAARGVIMDDRTDQASQKARMTPTKIAPK